MRLVKSVFIAVLFLLIESSALGASLEKVILPPNANIATSLARENKIYIIQYDYDLKGKSASIGRNSVLSFQGGSIVNGVIRGNNTFIDAAPVKIFDVDICFEGSFKNTFLYTEWFGAVGDDKTKAKDNTVALNAAIKAAVGSNSSDLEEALKSINCISLLNTTYYVNGVINVPAAYFKITANSITSIGYVNHKMPVIGQLANCPVISFEDRLIDETYYSHQLTHVVLENFKVYGSGVKSSQYGIGKEGCSSLNSCEFKNLLILGCRYGCYFDLTPKAGVYNNYFENVTTRECVLGFYIRTAVPNSNWMNVNTFSRCWFVNNRNSGLYIDRMMNQSVANLFETCTYEANGEGYDIDDYNVFGASGATLRGLQAEFHNCYFEANYASRYSKGNIRAGEAVFSEGGVGERLNCGAHIEPESLNDKEGNLVLGQGHVRLNGCSINIGHRLITCSPLSPQLDINGCNISNSYLNAKTTDALVTYMLDTNGNMDPVCLSISGLSKKSLDHSNQIKYAYRIDGNLNPKFSKKFSVLSNIDINVGSLESIDSPKEINQHGVLDETTIVYIDNINGNDRNTGTNAANALKTLSPLKDILSLDNNKSIKVVFTENYVGSDNIDVMIKDDDRIEFSSKDPNQPVFITVNSTFFGPQERIGRGTIIFRNINFKSEAPFIDTPIADCKWLFDNCSITINKGTFINCSKGSQDVCFKQCFFSAGSRKASSNINLTFSSGKGEINAQMIDCQDKINN